MHVEAVVKTMGNDGQGVNRRVREEVRARGKKKYKKKRGKLPTQRNGSEVQKVQGVGLAVGGVNELVHKEGEEGMRGVSRGSSADNKSLANVMKIKRQL